MEVEYLKHAYSFLPSEKVTAVGYACLCEEQAFILAKSDYLQCAVAHSRSTVWDGEFETVHRWNRFLNDNGIVRHLYYFVCVRSCKPILHRLRKS